MSQAVIFDLDDTLYPERQYALSGLSVVAACFAHVLGTNRRRLGGRMRELFDSGQRGRIFNAVVDVAASEGKLIGLPPSVVAAMIGTYHTHRPRITLFPDADRALARLAGVARLGIITDGPVMTQGLKIDALGVRARVHEVIVTGQWGREFWKPHPRAFEEMSRRLGVPHEACTYVADNPIKDFVAPRRLGWQTVMVRRADGIYLDRPASDGGRPDRTLDSLDEL